MVANFKPRCAVVIPAFNEERTVGAVVRDYIDIAEFVVVANDGSSDSTAEVAGSAGAIVLNLRHRGYGSAVGAGLRWAANKGIRYCITADADRAYDSSQAVVAFEHHVESGADLTIGTRFPPHAIDLLIPSTKRWSNHFAAALVNTICHTNLSDVACGLRVYGSRAMRLHWASAGFGMIYEAIALAAKSGIVLSQVPVRVVYDASELFCTPCREMVDFLSLCAEHCESALISASLSEMQHSLALRLSTWSIVCAKADGSSNVYWLHYIPDADGYIFQLQDQRVSGTQNQTSASVVVRVS